MSVLIRLGPEVQSTCAERIERFLNRVTPIIHEFDAKNCKLLIPNTLFPAKADQDLSLKVWETYQVSWSWGFLDQEKFSFFIDCCMRDVDSMSLIVVCKGYDTLLNEMLGPEGMIMSAWNE